LAFTRKGGKKYSIVRVSISRTDVLRKENSSRNCCSYLKK